MTVLKKSYLGGIYLEILHLSYVLMSQYNEVNLKTSNEAKHFQQMLIFTMHSRQSFFSLHSLG